MCNNIKNECKSLKKRGIQATKMGIFSVGRSKKVLGRTPYKVTDFQFTKTE